MRILVVQDTDWVLRGPHQQHHVFERLAERGHEVRVIDFPLLWRSRAVDPPAGTETTVRGKVIPSVQITLRRPRFRAIPLVAYASYAHHVRAAVDHEVKTRRPDVIVGHGILSDRAARKVATRHRIPYIAHWLDALDELVPVPMGRPLARRFIRANLSAASRVVVINKALGRYVQRRGARGQHVVEIPAGVAATRVSTNARQRVRATLGVGPTETLLVFVGWLYGFSGVDRVAESLLEESAATDIHLAVVGEGDLLPRLHELEARSSNRLHVLGQRPFAEIPEFLAASDACLLPAQLNPTMRHIVPIKLYEYLAAGRRTYLTRLPAVEEQFPGSVGLRYVDDPAQVVAELRRDGWGAAQALAQEAPIRSEVLGHDWSRIVTAWDTLLQEVTAR